MLKSNMIDRGLRKVARESSLLQSSLSYNWRAFHKRRKLPSLSPTNQYIVDAVRKEGAFITSLEALSLPLTEKLLEGAKVILATNPTDPAFESQYVYHVEPA